jgi:hypothetical protein
MPRKMGRQPILGRLAMLKRLIIGILGSALVSGTAAPASAQAMPPPKATGNRYVLPDAVAGYPGYRLQYA